MNPFETLSTHILSAIWLFKEFPLYVTKEDEISAASFPVTAVPEIISTIQCLELFSLY